VSRPLPPERRSSGELEDVALERDAGVELHELRDGESVVDAELVINDPKYWVVPVEEAVTVTQGGELLCPDRELELAELCVFHVPFGHHSNKSVESIDGPVDRLEARRDGGAADTGDHRFLGLLAVGSDEVTVGVPELDEVEDVRVVDRVPRVDQRIGWEALRGLAGDIDERCLRREPVRPAEVVVRRGRSRR